MMVREFRARHALGGTVRGQALVAGDGFSARYDLDRLEGVFSRPSHKLFGQSYVGRILILDSAKGGVATAWMLHEMKSRHMLPLAIVLNRANPIMAQGAALAAMTLVAGFEDDITAAVPSGALIEIDPEAGVLRVLDDAPATAGPILAAGYRKVHGP
jgi:predicted aconitase with swiveling domain